MVHARPTPARVPASLETMFGEYSRAHVMDWLRAEHARDTLDDASVSLLQRSVGWSWERDASRRVQMWTNRAAELEEFVERTGRAPKVGSDNEQQAATWLRYQRRNLERLNAFQLHRLIAIPHVMLEPRTNQWDDRIDAFADFVDEHGRHPRRHAHDEVERALAVWAGKQRSAALDGGLAPDRRVQCIRVGLFVRPVARLRRERPHSQPA